MTNDDFYAEPKRDFIMLPDGTVINVNQVFSVFQEEHHPGDVYIEGGIEGGSRHRDPDGKIYAWFANKAQPVGRGELMANVMTETEQLANVRKWVAYYKKDRDAANEEINRLEASNAELLLALSSIKLYILTLGFDTLGADSEDNYRDETIAIIDKLLDANAEATP